ncbi:molecular chaperone DnaJ [Tissierella creatinini]|nr:molecular chaperone DnaJ [Tissierella creatinini]TJX64667.1 molecular chaperone DnaJ [Soehngenia saccharolytica]
MNIIKKTSGEILYWITEGISFVLDFFIKIVDLTVSIVSGLARGLIALLGAGGCLFLVMMGPIGIALLLNPVTLLIILFFIIFPILGKQFVSFLKYIKYMVTEFLYDRADSLRKGKKSTFNTFNEYGRKYKKMEEERIRKEHQQRQYEQQKQWEERFRQWNDYQNSQRSGGYWGNGQSGGYGGQTYVNPTTEFKSKYEESCNLLGVDYRADKYQIKLAYRKKAKEYHPDINRAPDATRKFQQINDAYEFLNDDNIERYKGLIS